MEKVQIGTEKVQMTITIGLDENGKDGNGKDMTIKIGLYEN